jgi:glutamyl-tRNA(Gln) amidotransferase subunit E
MTFKPFNEMTEGDYTALGFKSGLEIHQQLLTSKKLFCRCPAGRYSDAFNAEILRHMRPTLSELGEYDGTALMEFKTKKEIIYQINHETVCTYEMDDTPPFELNDEALDIALEIGMLYGCTMVDEIHIARKQYLDGSIPTGFQRTTIVGVDGGIPYRGRRIDIVQLGLEEDACREVNDVGHCRTYRTDRLGMPLIETVTAPDMRTPQEVAEVADILRRMVRRTGRVRTGAGAARQDVNVSISGGTRIEIKGVPRIPDIPLLTYHEAMRQHNLLCLRDELRGRGITETTFGAKIEEVSRLLRKTPYQPLQDAIEQGQIVNSVLLRNFKGLLRWQTQTDTYFSREISDRVRVVACLTTLPNIIHSDSAAETLASSEWQMIKKAIGATDDDTIVIVWGNAQDAKTGASEITIRAKEATIGIPSETRQALRDGTNGFERILPGPNRMYPDTDLPPRRITLEHLGRITQRVSAQFGEDEQRYRELSIPEDLIVPLCSSPYAGLFETAVKEWHIPSTLAAVLLIQYPKRIARKRREPVEFSEDILKEILLACRDGVLAKEGILPVLFRVAAGSAFSRSALPGPCTNAELLALIAKAKAEMSAMKLHTAAKHTAVLLGLVMEKVRGRVDGGEVARRLTQAQEEVRP